MSPKEVESWLEAVNYNEGDISVTGASYYIERLQQIGALTRYLLTIEGEEIFAPVEITAKPVTKKIAEWQKKKYKKGL